MLTLLRHNLLIIIILLLTMMISSLPAQMKNGFDLSDALINPDEILSGGPPRDGIPAINHPRFVKAPQADFLKAEDRVYGIQYNGVVKAYPIKILNWHEIVNDWFGNDPLVITYCPLCGSGITFSRGIAGEMREFGVSGLLYNSDVLLYDKQTESLWSQIMGKAISGPLKGTLLEPIPMTLTTWQDWRDQYPETLVLSTETGFKRDYNRNPYTGYEQTERLMFPVSNENPAYHAKETVLAIERNGQFKAYPFSELQKAGSLIKDEIAGSEIMIHYNHENQSARALDSQSNEIHGVILYWFAWIAFHPESDVFKAQGENQ